MQGNAASRRNHIRKVSGETIHGEIELPPSDRVAIADHGGAIRPRMSVLRQRCRDRRAAGHALLAMAAGRSNAEIAEELFISELTVKSHIGRIFTKLGLRDRPAAIVYAYDHGLVRPGRPVTGSG